MTLRQTPLNAIHRKYGARLIDFAGWEMPVQYEGALREHQSVREAVGVFDVSHMGELEIVGPDALPMVQKVTCNDVSRLSDGQAQYSALLYPNGTFVDDIVVYRISSEHFFLCVNAANKDKDFQWISRQVEGEAEVLDSSARFAQLAVQGPYSSRVLQKLTSEDLSAIKFYWCVRGSVAGTEVLLSRTGYTGEDGFELYLAPDRAETMWEALFDAGREFGIKPAGLAARNTLRLEMRYPLYGHDISDATNPFEAGLAWIVKLSKGEFVGRTALEEVKASGTMRLLVGFELTEPGIARDGFPVFVEGQPRGSVTSGSFSPSLGKSIGLAYLPIEHSEVGTEFGIEVRGSIRGAKVVQTPFYQRQKS